MNDSTTPSVHVDGFPVAVTIDSEHKGDLDDMGTGAGRGQYHWTAENLEIAANRSVLDVTPDRVTRA